jgi:hypothetical protein
MGSICAQNDTMLTYIGRNRVFDRWGIASVLCHLPAYDHPGSLKLFRQVFQTRPHGRLTMRRGGRSQHRRFYTPAFVTTAAATTRLLRVFWSWRMMRCTSAGAARSSSSIHRTASDLPPRGGHSYQRPCGRYDRGDKQRVQYDTGDKQRCAAVAQILAWGDGRVR